MTGTAVYEDRLRRVTEYMRREGPAQIIVSAVPSVFWLTGVRTEPHERMLALYLDIDGRAVLFANRLFAIDRDALSCELVLHGDGDDPVGGLASILKSGAVGIDKSWTARFLLKLMARRPDIKPCPGSAPVDTARMRKDGEEIKLMRAASRMNDKAMAAVIAALRKGMTEARLAAFVSETYAELGADLPIGVQIVCFGKNAADPHHMPDNTALKEGDCALFDIFTPVSGYWCDMTRTVYFGSVSKEEETIYETVRRANIAAIEAVRPGVPMKRIDAAARGIISDAGFGEYFIHRLGHGAGLECHEPPDCSATSDVPAEPGMIFSIEPGIYLPGRFGVRIEDLVLVTETGCEVLNRAPKELLTVS
jgi:Xaa-Pro dipeptidase